MEILIKNARVIAPGQPLDNTLQNILVSNGKVAYVGNQTPTASQVIAQEGLHISAGWFDLRAALNQPGHEENETLEALINTAATAGFTGLLVMPAHTTPPLGTAAEVQSLITKTASAPCRIWPAALTSVNAEGQKITEMLDLAKAGAIAFTDLPNRLHNPDIVLKALQYLQQVNLPLINQPEDYHLGLFGQMHEGPVNAGLGLKGIPALAEELMAGRDARLLEYAGGHLHLTCLTTHGAVCLVANAQSKGLRLTADVAAYQLVLTDEALQTFEPNYKTSPPLRSKAHIEALMVGIENGNITAVCSNHQPQNYDVKQCEFDFAQPGIAALETTFSNLCALQPRLGLAKIISLLTTGPRAILGLPMPQIKVGHVAEFTLFDPNLAWTPNQHNFTCPSKNNPFIGQQLTGKALGVINGANCHLNPSF